MVLKYLTFFSSFQEELAWGFSYSVREEEALHK